MSSVDSADNMHVGDFVFTHKLVSLIPIYWVLSELHHDRTGELIARNDLLIGGGSGEHPALHVKNADLLALWVMIQNDDLTDDEYETVRIFYEKILDKRFPDEIDFDPQYIMYDFSMFVDLNDWPISTIGALQTCFANRPLGEESLRHSAETAFMYDFGAFIINYMPIEFFNDAELLAFLKQHKHLFPTNLEHEKVFDIKPVCSPDSGLGKRIIDNKVVWGWTLTEYMLEHPDIGSLMKSE